MKRLFSIILLLLYSVAGWAHTGSLRGTICDSTGKPLEGVSIYIPKAALSAVTDAFGKFFVKGIGPGKYMLSVTHLGYTNIDDEVKIEDGVTTEVAYKMLAASVQMKEVSVNAKRDMNLSSISGVDLKLRPVNNTQDMLRLVPGLFTAQHQGGGKAEQIFLRGFDCDHGTDVNISVDNMPVNMVSHAHGQGFADAHFIIPESVQAVDYGKGPYQIDKGDFCTAGFVAFKTKNAIDNNFIKVDGGMYGYFRTAAGINLLNKAQNDNTHQDAYIMAEYGYNRGYFDMSQNFNRFNLMGKYTDYISGNKILSLTVSGFNSFWSASGQIPTRAVSEGVVDRYGDIDPEGGNTSRFNMNLQYLQNISSNTYFKSNLYLTYYTFRLYSDFTYFLIDTVNGDQICQAEKRAMVGYNTEYITNYKFRGLKIKTQLGMGMRYDVMNDELSHTLDRSIILNSIELGDVHETNFYGYANEAVYLLPQLVLNAGARYDYFIQQYDNKLAADMPRQIFNNGRLNPKAGLYYNFSDNAHIYYSYGTGFHTNDARALALGRQMGGSIIVNNTIPQAFSHDLGIVVKPNTKLLLSAAVWLLNLQQEFTYNGDVAVIDTSGKTRRYGVDFSARYEICKWFYADVDVNYAHGHFVDKPLGNNFIPLAPPLTSIGGLTVKPNKNFLAGIRYRYMSNRPANTDGTQIALGYTVFDAVAGYTLGKYEFGMQIQNIFNVQWNEAQFDTETRLKHPNGALEKKPVTDVCYTPGTPFFLKVNVSYKFRSIKHP